MGAKYSTASQNIAALQLKGNPDLIAKNFHDALKPLNSNSSEFNVYQRIYLQEGEQIQPAFVQHVTNDFFSNLIQINYGDVAGTLFLINRFAAYKTNNLIQNIISPNIIKNSTEMILVSTMLFEAQWDVPFPVMDTCLKNFYIDEVYTIPMKTMHLKVYQLLK